MSANCLLGAVFLVASLPAAADLEPITGWAQQGRVEISAVHGWGVAVGLDTWTKTGEPDGWIDRVYLLQAFGPKPRELPLSFEVATVLETPDGIRVLVDDQKLDFRLELASGDALFGAQGLAADGVYHYRGFGLSRTDSLRMAFPLESSWIAQYGLPDLGRSLAAGACDSGGTGATSCSVQNGHGGCSITCASGYYACCENAGWASAASCSCVAISAGSGGGSGGGGGGFNDECRRNASGFCDVSCMSCSLY